VIAFVEAAVLAPAADRQWAGNRDRGHDRNRHHHPYSQGRGATRPLTAFQAPDAGFAL